MIAYVGLGSNVGDREAMLRAALDLLADMPSTALARVSSFYDTEPMGDVEQPWFLNAVAELDSDLSPGQVMWNLQRIERGLGRVRNERWGPRTIDLDLLLVDSGAVDEPGLTVPHAELLNRPFALIPLLEIDPQLKDPRTGESLAQHLKKLNDRHVVNRVPAEPRT